ncbi:DUF742 domain-containing protein [Nocardia yamanashiensis]|uniref:DUF742 domain-containing protein n=1 Tax=Nocardia yamanashiensis TaxID=209247 RepID=UPI00082BF42C|nr:DUF742 domain-containing protein [Nocardia yamanashiensis]UGT45515.1 DUF742 domain-containing protein [Nocardia yamanashiensis]
MSDAPESWYDEDAGPVVRLYAVTRGRSETRRTDVDILTRVVTSRFGRLRRDEPEYAAIVELTRAPLSVAEIAAQLRLPITATKILVGDLIADGVLDFRAPAADQGSADDLAVLRAVLKGIRAL